MKKAILVVITVLILVFSLFAAGEESAEQEKEAIKNAALDYIEGWYEGSAERMERALHPDLNKKGVQVIPKTRRTILNFASASMMVESAWVCGSTKPGQVIRPVPSMTVSALPLTSPRATTRSPRMATLPGNPTCPVPSMMRVCSISTS